MVVESNRWRRSFAQALNLKGHLLRVFRVDPRVRRAVFDSPGERSSERGAHRERDGDSDRISRSRS
jgi:hypothetical protein